MLSLISYFLLFCSSFNFLQFIISLFNHFPLLPFSPFPIIFYILLLRHLTFILFHSLLLSFFLIIFIFFYLFPFCQSVSILFFLLLLLFSFFLPSFSSIYSTFHFYTLLHRLFISSSSYTSPLTFFAFSFFFNCSFYFLTFSSPYFLCSSHLSPHYSLTLPVSSFRSLSPAGGTVLRCLASALHSAASTSGRKTDQYNVSLSGRGNY